jgi:hypothetical protein
MPVAPRSASGQRRPYSGLIGSWFASQCFNCEAELNGIVYDPEQAFATAYSD